ncbi:sigma-54-dependent Fis family transcriptional regulator [bacterium]|nr:sigma-54-dependent Fis family transcriptional regulator [bacterium]
MKSTILVVDDEKNTREGLRRGLEPLGYEVRLAADASEAIETLKSGVIDLMLTDLRMPGMDGLELIKVAQRISPDTQIIMLTAYPDHKTAVEAMRHGAYDYLEKPYQLDVVESRVRHALASARLRAENVMLRERLQKNYGFENILGNSAAMKRVFETVRQVAPTKANVLIVGDSGTGKELIANAIHNISPRKDKPFIAVHCAALSKSLLESELFGHEKGAFTGAIASKPGRFERADGGTLFLDEVGEIDLDIQVKLLRFLEEWEFERVGGVKTIKVDVRLITATNRDPTKLVEAGRFREDLYYRLNVVTINVPPLRERKEDIPIMVSAFLAEFSLENKKDATSISPDVLEALVAYDWPGNVRELRNVVESLVVLCPGDTIVFGQLPQTVKGTLRGKQVVVPGQEMGEVPGRQIVLAAGTSLRDAEKRLIQETLRNNDNNISKAARILNISRRTLHRKLHEYNIDLSRRGPRPG